MLASARIIRPSRLKPHKPYERANTSKQRRRRSRKPVIQPHHISYDPEIIVKVWQGEHWILTQVNRRKKISKGYIEALKQWILVHEDVAEEL